MQCKKIYKIHNFLGFSLQYDKMATIDPSRYSELCRLCAATTTMILAVHIFQNEGVIGQLRKKIESCLSIQVRKMLGYVSL